MSEIYSASYQVGWIDIDANGHMSNSRYLDYATQTRFRCLAERGFSPDDFRRHGIGPVMFEDTLRYRSELRFLDEFTVSFEYERLDEEGRKFRVVNRFTRAGEEVAVVDARGAWFDLETRSVVVPPAKLLAALSSD
ncbi:MAG: thioesterase family protein [Thermoanaerobaculia bacterium]|nr:thioesterase family protein [Thermoanaerobaculia bacterium]